MASPSFLDLTPNVTAVEGDRRVAEAERLASAAESAAAQARGAAS